MISVPGNSDVESTAIASHISPRLQTAPPPAKREDRAGEALGRRATEIVAAAVPATAAPAPAATATTVARCPANSVPSQSSEPALDMEVSNAPHGRALVHDHRGHGGRGESHETVARERLAGVEGEREAATRSLQRSARRRLATR